MSKESHIFEDVFEPLGKRILNSLLSSDYDSLEELHELSDKDLTKITGISKNAVSSIRGLLAARGFEPVFELEKTNAVAALGASQAVPDKKHVREPGSGNFMPRRSGQVVMLINLYDPGFRRKNNDQKLSVVVGDVIWGNKDKQWDLPQEKVDELVTKGDAA